MTIPPLLALQGLPLLQTAVEGSMHILSEGFAPMLKAALQTGAPTSPVETAQPAEFPRLHQELLGLLDQLGYGDTLPLSIHLHSGSDFNLSQQSGNELPFADLLQSNPRFAQLIASVRRSLPANATGTLHLNREALTFQS